MANADNAASRSSLGWLPKLVLWGVVVAFGYLYLSSIDREEGKPSAAAFMDSLAKLSPVPINILPNSHKEAVAPAASEGSKVAAVPSGAEGRQPVREAESSVFANSLMRQPVSAPAVAAQGGETPVPASVAPVFGFAPPPMPTAPAVPASAPISTQEPAAAGAAAQSMPSQPASSGGPYDWEAINKRRAEMMAQYEAMRREADERMRQQWEQARAYAPPVPYGYGYPGYGPAAYPPGVYAPVR